MIINLQIQIDKLTNFFVFLIYPRIKVTCLLPNNNYPNAIAMPTDFL